MINNSELLYTCRVSSVTLAVLCSAVDAFTQSVVLSELFVCG